MITVPFRLFPILGLAVAALACDISSSTPFEVREATIDGPVASYVIAADGETFAVERIEANDDVAVFVSAESGPRLTALADRHGLAFLDEASDPLPLTAVDETVRTVVDAVVQAHPLEGTPMPSFRRMKSHDNCSDLGAACAATGNAYEFCAPGMLEYYCNL